MFVGEYLICFFSGDEIHDIVSAEVFLYGNNGFQGYDHLVHSFNLLPWMETVVAVAAIVFVILLAKIVQQHFSSTNGSLCICGSLL